MVKLLMKFLGVKFGHPNQCKNIHFMDISNIDYTLLRIEIIFNNIIISTIKINFIFYFLNFYNTSLAFFPYVSLYVFHNIPYYSF
jgi:hypothetical protein